MGNPLSLNGISNTALPMSTSFDVNPIAQSYPSSPSFVEMSSFEPGNMMGGPSASNGLSSSSLLQQLISLLLRIFGGANGSSSPGNCPPTQPQGQLPACGSGTVQTAPAPARACGTTKAPTPVCAKGNTQTTPSTTCATGSQQPVQIQQNTPTGSLKVNGNTVTTPGGYQIVPTKQYEWKIIGPDGKSSRIYGDPHVDVGSDQVFDFTKNSTFTLADGTNIDVTTKPYVNSLGKLTDQTVTSSLDIVNGNDHVKVSGIDQGTGTAGSVQNNGQQVQNSFSGPDYTMGTEANQWSLNGQPVATHNMNKPAT